jgi:hypothetical protein
VLFDHYLYLSGVSASFKAHLERMADGLVGQLKLGPGAKVVDIGGNDGTLLHAFQQHGCQVLNIEPAANVAELSQRRSIPTWSRYFDADCADDILAFSGPVDLVTATNVFAHVDDVGELLRNVRRVLVPGGSLVIEVPDARIMLQSGTYDLVYHEHLSYWTPASLHCVAGANGLFIHSIQPVNSHGGSLRVQFQVEVASTTPTWEREVDLASFVATVQSRRRVFRDLLLSCKGAGSVAGYTSPAKATVIANYCGLDAGDLDWILDDAPTKQGKFLPLSTGRGIPIVDSEYANAHPVHTLVLFSWNLATELADKALDSGWCQQVLIPMPEPRLIRH